MKGLFFDGSLSLKIDLPQVEPQPGEVLVRVLLAGICATDLQILEGYMAFRGVPGHEFVGIVEGPACSPWYGKRVVSEINCGCLRCPVCRSGDQRHCPNRTVLGIAGRDGVFAEYAAVPEDRLHQVPEAITDHQAVFVEPLAAAARVLSQVPQVPPQVLVIGDGKLGLLVAQVLCGRTEVHMLGKHPERAGEILGERVTVEQGDSGQPFPLVVEASGSPEGLRCALRRVEPEGTVVLKSTYHGSTAVDFSLQVVVPEVTLIGSRCGSFPEAIELLACGAVSVDPLIEAVYEFDLWQEAFGRASAPGTLKVLLQISR